MNPTKERFLLAATVLLFSGMLLAGDEQAEIEALVASYSELNQFSGSILVAAKGEFDEAIAIVDDLTNRNGQSVRIRLARLKLELRKRQEDELSNEVDKIVSLMHGGR